MPTTRSLRKPLAAAAALLGLLALSVGTGANADPRSAATPTPRGPHNENYDPPVYTPVQRPVYKSTPGNPLVRPWGVYQGLAEHSWLPYLAASEDQKVLLDKIVQRPKATWFGAWHRTRRSPSASRSTSSSPRVATPTSSCRCPSSA